MHTSSLKIFSAMGQPMQPTPNSINSLPANTITIINIATSFLSIFASFGDLIGDRLN